MTIESMQVEIDSFTAYYLSKRRSRMGMVVHICDRDDRRVFTISDAPIVCGEQESKISAPYSYWSNFAFETHAVEVMDELFPIGGEPVQLEMSHLEAFSSVWKNKNNISVEHHEVLDWFIFWIRFALANLKNPIVIHY